MQDSDIAFLQGLARTGFPGHLRSKVDPGDIVQEAMLRIHKASGDFKDRSDLEKQVYLRRVLESVLADTVRRFNRSKRSAVKEQPIHRPAAETLPVADEGLVADITSPSQRAIRNELCLRLSNRLAKLPEMQRRAIDLHHLQGLSLAETAELLCTTKHAVAGLLRRGLHTLRGSMVDAHE